MDGESRSSSHCVRAVTSGKRGALPFISFKLPSAAGEQNVRDQPYNLTMDELKEQARILALLSWQPKADTLRKTEGRQWSP